MRARARWRPMLPSLDAPGAQARVRKKGTTDAQREEARRLENRRQIAQAMEAEETAQTGGGELTYFLAQHGCAWPSNRAAHASSIHAPDCPLLPPPRSRV